jgi:hypothetical protein
MRFCNHKITTAILGLSLCFTFCRCEALPNYLYPFCYILGSINGFVFAQGEQNKYIRRGLPAYDGVKDGLKQLARSFACYQLGGALCLLIPDKEEGVWEAYAEGIAWINAGAAVAGLAQLLGALYIDHPYNHDNETASWERKTAQRRNNS